MRPSIVTDDMRNLTILKSGEQWLVVFFFVFVRESKDSSLRVSPFEMSQDAVSGLL